eukprot:Opistho-2@91861
MRQCIGHSRSPSWSSAAQLVQLASVALLVHVVAVAGSPVVGGPGGCLFFSDPSQFAVMYDSTSSPEGGVQTITGFPARAVTIEYWIRYVKDVKNPDQIYLVFGYASSNVVSSTGETFSDDNVFQCCSIIDGRQSVMVLPSLSGGKPIVTPRGDEYTIKFDRWYHFAITFEATYNLSSPSAVNVYRDGELFMNALNPQYGNASMPSSGTFVLAQDQDTVGGGFDTSQALVAFVDEFRIWSVVRTQDEIKQGMFKELDGTETNLWAYYKFDEGTGDIAYNKVNASRYPFKLASGAAFPATPSQKPLWATSRAPVWGSSALTALINRGKITRVELSPTSAANITLGSISGSSCAGKVDFFSDEAGTSALADSASLGANAPYAFVRIASGAPTPFVSCFVPYDVTNVYGTAAQRITFSENPVPTVESMTLSFAEDANIVFPLTGKDNEIISTVIVTSLPKKGTLYALTTGLVRDYPLLANGSNQLASGGPMQYVPLPNNYGSPYDTFKYRVMDASGGLSAEATVVINITPADDLPVAGNNPYYLDFIRTGVVFSMPTLDPSNGGATFSVAFFAKFPALPSSQQNNYTVFYMPAAATPPSYPYSLRLSSNGRLVCAVAGSDSVSVDITSLVGDAWFHVSVGFSGTTVIMHLNGAWAANGTAPSRPTVTPGIVLGGFVGSVDEFSVYNRILTVSDLAVVRTVKQSSLSGALVAAFSFDEGINLESKCYGTSGACAFKGLLGDGEALKAPMWMLTPPRAAASFSTFPQFETIITDEDVARVVNLRAIDVDTDARALSLVIMNAPSAGKLYQYDDSAPNKRGAAIDPYVYWRNTIEPVTIYPFRAFGVYLPLPCCSSEAAFFDTGNAVTRFPCRFCEREDNTLFFSTQFGYVVYGVYALLFNGGRPYRYNPDNPPTYGYGDFLYAYSPQSSGDPDSNGKRDCADKVPGDISQNLFQWSCPKTTENEYFEIGFKEPL